MPYLKLPHYTYDKKKICPNCGCEIPDQIHASRKFCPPYRLPDGTKINCKDQYHSPLKKQKNAPYNKIADFHRKTRDSIDMLRKAKGADVTIEDLNQYGIRLNRPVEWEANNDQVWTYYYVDFSITQFPNHKYKISQHARIFQ